MTPEKFRQRMYYDVGAVLERPQKHRRRHCIVHEQRYAVLMRDFRQCLEVANISRGVAHAFAEHSTRAAVY